MDLGLEGKRALVLGASRGIGRGIAESLIAEGVEVAIAARGAECLEQTGKDIGARLCLTGDLRVAATGTTLVTQMTERLGAPDIVICNTGGPARALFDDTTAEDWHVGFQSLWMSVIETVQAATPSMRENRFGRVVVVSSTAGKEPQPGLTVASALRAGLHGLIRIMSTELGVNGITANAVLPGFVLTERLKQTGFPLDKAAALIPAGRVADPQDVGDLVTFLSSRRASYISGQLIACDGGFLKGI